MVFAQRRAALGMRLLEELESFELTWKLLILGLVWVLGELSAELICQL